MHRPPSHVEVHPDYPDENIRIHPAREDEADEQRLSNAVGVAHDFLVLVEFLKGIYTHGEPFCIKSGDQTKHGSRMVRTRGIVL